MTERPVRSVAESQNESNELIMPHDANILGHAFGGAIMAMVDKSAAVAAFRHARTNCVTASIDRVDFREPIHVGELVTCRASVNFVGNTSMEVGVRVESECRSILDALTESDQGWVLCGFAAKIAARAAIISGCVSPPGKFQGAYASPRSGGK